MSVAVNFSSLSSVSTLGDSDQLLVRFDNSLSGTSGFGRINRLNFEKSLDVYTVVQSNSAQWSIDSTTDTGVRALTANWQNTYTGFSAQSANNLSVYSTVQSTSSNWSVFTGTISAATFITSVTSAFVTNYQFVLSNANKTIIDTLSTNTYYGVPNNGAVSFPIGSQLIIIQGNKTTNNYTILSAGQGVTINSFNNSLSLAGNYAAGTLIKTDTNVWYLIGNLK